MAEQWGNLKEISTHALRMEGDLWFSHTLLTA